MAWVARNSDNTPRTPSPYVRHDENNSVATPAADYVRHDEDNNADAVQPTSVEATDDYGNTYDNYNGDYVAHLSDNSPKVPLSGSGNSTVSGTLQDGQTVTVDGEATFTGGASPVTKEFQWQISDTGSGSWSGWGTGWVSYDSTIIGETKLVATGDVGKFIRAQQRATDGDGVVVTRAGTVYGPIIS